MDHDARTTPWSCATIMASKSRWTTVSDGRTNEGTATKNLRPRLRAVDAVGLKRDCSGSDSGVAGERWSLGKSIAPESPARHRSASCHVVVCRVVSWVVSLRTLLLYLRDTTQTAVRLSRLHRHGRPSQWRRWRALQRKRVVRVVRRVKRRWCDRDLRQEIGWMTELNGFCSPPSKSIQPASRRSSSFGRIPRLRFLFARDASKTLPPLARSRLTARISPYGPTHSLA